MMLSSIIERVKFALRGRKPSARATNNKPAKDVFALNFRRAVICQLCGGLANQIICYKLARYLAETQGRTLVLDISWYANQPRDTNRNLQLLNYNISYDAVTDSSACISMILSSHKTTRLTVEQFENFKQEDVKQEALRRLESASELIVCDLWGALTLREAADDFARTNYRHEFTIRDVADNCDRGRRIMNLIQQCQNPVAIHVRRGDFAVHDDNLLLTDSYFNDAIRTLEQELQSPSFFVFSDDIGWCRDHLKSEAAIYFVDFNDERHGYRDLLLGAACRHFILSNCSTFSHQMVELSQQVEDRRILRSTNADLIRNQAPR